MKDLKNILIVILVIIIIFLFTCNKPVSETEVVTKTVTRVDSVRVTDTIVEYIHGPMRSVEIHDTVFVYGDVKTYKYRGADSLLSYQIEVDTDCYPDDVRLEYDLKQLTIRDSIYIRDSVHVQEQIKKSFLSIGATLLGSKETFGFAPHIMYSHKKGNNYSLGYDLINGNVMLGFSKKISFKK